MGKSHAKQTARAHGALALQIPAEMEERRRNAELAYSTIRQNLGREGTFDTPSGAPGGAPGGSPGLFKEASVSGVGAYGGAEEVKAYRGGTPLTLDPDAVARATMDSPEFRIASRLTAESEQMLKREGPLWEEMNKSITGSIIEGSSAMLKEQSEALRRQYARGGSARNRARQSVQEIRNIESANKVRQDNLWQSSLALNQWARDNARTQLNFNESWAANVGGVRESYLKGMENIGKFIVETAIPISAGQHMQANVISEMQRQEKRGKIKKIAGIAIGAAALIAAPFTGGATIPLALGSLGGALGGPEVGASLAELGQVPQIQTGIAGGIGKIGNLLRPGGNEVNTLTASR